MFDFLKRSKPSPSGPAHTAGVKEGNARGNLKKEEGLVTEGDADEGAKARARRSTGINPSAREPIDPRMPNLPPP